MDSKNENHLTKPLKELGKAIDKLKDNFEDTKKDVENLKEDLDKINPPEKMPETILECFSFEPGTQEELDTIEFLQTLLKFIRNHHDMFMALFLASGFSYDEESGQPAIAVGHPYLTIANSAPFLSAISSPTGQALRQALEKKVVRALADAHDELRRRHFTLEKELNDDGK